MPGHVICLTPQASVAMLERALEARGVSSPRSYEHAKAQAIAELERQDRAPDSSSDSEPEEWDIPVAARSARSLVRAGFAGASLSKFVVAIVVLLNVSVVSGVVYCLVVDRTTTPSRSADVRSATDASSDGGSDVLLASDESWQSPPTAVTSEGPRGRSGAANRSQPGGLAARPEGQAEGAFRSSHAVVAEPVGDRLGGPQSERRSGNQTSERHGFSFETGENEPKESEEAVEEEDREEPNDTIDEDTDLESKPEWFRRFENRTAARMDKIANDLKQMGTSDGQIDKIANDLKIAMDNT